MHADLIGKPLQMPWRLRFDRDCLIVLRRSLLAVAPEEGCALLLGDSGCDPRVRVVWPCCNVWRPGQWGMDDQTDGRGCVNPSRQTRFALDPLEQIAAQRWGRRWGLVVLGSAHSHPGGVPVPSRTDRLWAAANGVMVIDAGARGLAGWWMERSIPGPDSTPVRPAEAHPLRLMSPEGALLGDTGLSPHNSHCCTFDDGSASGV